MASLSSADPQVSLISPLSPATGSGETALSAGTDAAFAAILDQLLRLRSSPDDWDGQGSRRLDPRNVDLAINWVKDMRRWRRALPPTLAVPGTSGEVVLEWRRQGFYLAGEISDGEHVEWVLSLPGQPVKQWQTDLRSTWIVCAENGSP